MKTLIIFSSQTGFTKRYAEWIAEETDAELISLSRAKKKNADYFDTYDAILYGGWTMAGRVVKADWYFKRAEKWKDKKLLVFCVGASPMENPEIQTALDNMLTSEQKEFIKIFYCPGGIAYDKMNLFSRLAMKAFASALKKDADPDKQKQGAIISESYDIADKQYIQPILGELKK
ncbi:MAG: flavodoxin domain-containing protein [Acetatifactor sp.]|nr:flavodoxin domain-containing protein [Acetatifactor sp.]